MKKNAFTSNTPTAENRQSLINLSPCTCLAGIPFPTWGSPGLAKLYALSPMQQLPEHRRDLGDLAWAVCSALTGLIPTQPWLASHGWAMLVEFSTFIEGHPDAETVQIIATIGQGENGETVLHLSLPDEAEGSKRVRILILDGDADTAKWMILLLSRRRFEVLSLSTGDKVLETVLQASPVLILMEVDLLGMNGFQLCRALKSDQRTSSIPVIFCTATHGLKEQARAVGALDCLEKPLDLIGLPERLWKLLEDLEANTAH